MLAFGLLPQHYGITLRVTFNCLVPWTSFPSLLFRWLTHCKLWSLYELQLAYNFLFPPSENSQLTRTFKSWFPLVFTRCPRVISDTLISLSRILAPSLAINHSSLTYSPFMRTHHHVISMINHTIVSSIGNYSWQLSSVRMPHTFQSMVIYIRLLTFQL